jgi:hypothetical protein
MGHDYGPNYHNRALPYTLHFSKYRLRFSFHAPSPGCARRLSAEDTGSGIRKVRNPTPPAGIVVAENIGATLTIEGAMANESNPDRGTAGPSAPDERSGITSEQKLAASLPVYETEQPDPAQLGAGHLGVSSITLAVIAAAVILGVVLYGLNSTPPAPQAAAPAQTASSAPTSGGGAANPAPKAGKNGHS